VLNGKKSKNLLQKGFTLVELMIVIVIVGVLSSVALPNFLSQTEKAKATEAKTAGSAAVKTMSAQYLEDPQTLVDGALVKVAAGGLCPDDTTEFVYTCAANLTGVSTITGTIQKGALKDSTIITKFNAAAGGRPEICSAEAKTGLPACT
jgi:type IV pilus assembly protein PilA